MNMSTNEPALPAKGIVPVAEGHEARELLTVTIDGERIGIPVLDVQDVLGAVTVTRVPLAPASVAGSLNLRGRIVTAFDVRPVVGLAPADPSVPRMGVVVAQGEQCYALLVDSVGEVLRVTQPRDSTPGTVKEVWRRYALGVTRLPGGLLTELDIGKLLRAASA